MVLSRNQVKASAEPCNVGANALSSSRVLALPGAAFLEGVSPRRSANSFKVRRCWFLASILAFFRRVVRRL